MIQHNAVKRYGSRETACKSKRTQQPKRAYEEHADAWRAIRRSENMGLVPMDTLRPYPCDRHGFHIGAVPRYRRGNRVRRG